MSLRTLIARPAARLATLLAVAGAAAAGATCASPGVPPGGPEDYEPPRIVRVAPDTGATDARPRAVIFEFDEVVSELPAGRGGGASASSGSTALANIFVVSPRDGAPDVDWQRDRISIRQRRNWRPNTTYTITMLPGLADLRNNVRDSAVVVWFSTGPTVDAASVRGIVFDWVAGKPAPGALVEAIAADSTTYIALADSVGRFEIRRMRAGPYTVRGIIDADNDRGLDLREAWASAPVDSSAVALRDTTRRLELLAFVHDTTGPRIENVTFTDSVTLRVTFSQPLDPDTPISPARFSVATRDSVAVPIANVYPGAFYDTLQASRQRLAADSAARRAADSLRAANDSAFRADSIRRETARRDSVRRADSVRAAAARAAARDTTRRARGDTVTPRPSRPSPSADVVIVLARPLAPNTFYRVTATEARSVSKFARTSQRTITTPRPPAAPAPARGDSARRDSVRRDSIRRDSIRADSLRRRPGGPGDGDALSALLRPRRPR